MAGKNEIIVISVGGSLIAPEGVNYNFLKAFREVIMKFLKKGKRFVIIAGGGKTARTYQNAAKLVVNLSNEDSDWLGIHATRLNGHLLRAVFKDVAHSKIIKNPTEKSNFKEKVLIAAGWKPGCSTDYDAVLLAKNLRVKKLVNLSNIDYVYDRDPKKHKGANEIKEISWSSFRKLMPIKWSPGLNVPFDSVAAKEAEKLKLEVTIMNGNKLNNFESYLEGKKFDGTVIK